MTPYTSGVVGEIGRLGQRQFNELLAPAATAGAAGSGQFGSRRGMQVYGNVARDVSSDILGRQTGALQAGYKDALTAALNEQQIQNQAAQTLGSLSGQAYTQGVGGLNALSTLGAQQQATEQARLNYPMTAAQAAASVMKGFTVPTSVSQTTTQPAGQGQMQLSPLSQIGSLIGTLGTAANYPAASIIPGATGTLGSWLINYFKNTNSPEQLSGPTDTSQTTGGGIVQNTDGTYTTSSGNVVNPDEYSAY
jgi:hypothetical protein